jgi:hypothetical protein
MLGMALGSLLTYDAWATRPVYVVSPASQYACGVLAPPQPNNPLPPQTQLQLGVLSAMSNPQQDPNAPDPQAGLYAATGPNIDPANPGQKISPQFAFNLLRKNEGVYFHAPNAAFERLDNLGDLDAYLYTQQDQPPANAAVLPQS